MAQAAKKDDGVVSIHGKQYLTVARRVADFREKHPDHTIACELVSADDDRVVMKATISADHKVIATGYAEENRHHGNINKTSALENAETSAVGRALAFFGMGGTEIASADEVANAITQQASGEALQPILDHMQAVRDNWPSIAYIKSGIENGDLSTAVEAWRELDQEVQMALWKAPSKGGIFTTHERTVMKSNEWNAVSRAEHGDEK